MIYFWSVENHDICPQKILIKSQTIPTNIPGMMIVSMGTTCLMAEEAWISFNLNRPMEDISGAQKNLFRSIYFKSVPSEDISRPWRRHLINE